MTIPHSSTLAFVAPSVTSSARHSQAQKLQAERSSTEMYFLFRLLILLSFFVTMPFLKTLPCFG